MTGRNKLTGTIALDARGSLTESTNAWERNLEELRDWDRRYDGERTIAKNILRIIDEDHLAESPAAGRESA